MEKFKKDFEIRRVIFGLTSIIRTNLQQLPQLIAQRLPDIFAQLVILANKMKKERELIVKDNEEFIKKEE